MSKVKNAFVNAQTKFMCRMAGVPTEHGDHLLEVLGTIIIAVVILIFSEHRLSTCSMAQFLIPPRA